MVKRKHEYILWPNTRLCFDPETKEVSIYHPEHNPEEIVLGIMETDRYNFTDKVWPFSTQIG